MTCIRTDLAAEAREIFQNANSAAEAEGVTAKSEKKGSVTVTKIEIKNENGAKALGKPIGKYITIESPEIKYSVEEYERTCKIISDSLIEMTGDVTDKTILIAGLGNSEITPDALGPAVVSRLIVTRHMKEHMGKSFGSEFPTTCAVAPGVLGMTGIETADIISGVAGKVRPDLVIAVDALAARKTERISTTIQICDTGIQPGAGIGNRRSGLDENTLGTKVIAIGVPTVVDAATIVRDGIEAAFEDEDAEKISEKILSDNMRRMVVTPKDIDLVIERASKTVANGINMALNRELSLEDIESFVG